MASGGGLDEWCAALGASSLCEPRPGLEVPPRSGLCNFFDPTVHRGGASMQNHSWFHWYGGVFFRRAEDGTVEIGEGPDFDNVTVKHRIDPGSWASIVSSVSHRGEDHFTFNEAKRFHMGEVE